MTLDIKQIRSWQITQSLVATILGIVLTALSYGIAYMVGWDVQFSWLEVIALSTSYSCTWLCVVQSRLNYLLGTVSVVLYSALFLQNGFTALAVFNLYLVGSLIYGFFRWRKDSNPRLVTSLGFDKWTVGYATIGVTIAAVCIAVNIVYPNTFAPMDIIITALSGMAQTMLDNKRLENWYIWLVVNLISIYAFYNAEMYLVLLQYVFFTVNVFIGYTSWKRSM